MNQTKTIFYFPSLALAHLYSIIPLRMLFITFITLSLFRDLHYAPGMQSCLDSIGTHITHCY